MKQRLTSLSTSTKIGVVTSGTSYQYAKENILSILHTLN